MAKNPPRRKERLIEALILVFVIASVSIVIVQLGMNVRDALEQSQAFGGQLTSGEELNTPTPPGPTPTIDFSLPVSEESE
jgi:hypothetical protein